MGNSCRNKQRCTNSPEDRALFADTSQLTCGYYTKIQQRKMMKVEKDVCSACACQSACAQKQLALGKRKELGWTYKPSRAVCFCIDLGQVRQVKNVDTSLPLKEWSIS